jgi:hypothetical protein
MLLMTDALSQQLQRSPTRRFPCEKPSQHQADLVVRACSQKVAVVCCHPLPQAHRCWSSLTVSLMRAIGLVSWHPISQPASQQPTNFAWLVKHYFSQYRPISWAIMHVFTPGMPSRVYVQACKSSTVKPYSPDKADCRERPACRWRCAARDVFARSLRAENMSLPLHCLACRWHCAALQSPAAPHRSNTGWVRVPGRRSPLVLPAEHA